MSGFTAILARDLALVLRRPGDVGLVDEVGAPLTFGEIEARTNAIARGLAAAGVKCGDGVGLYARNHRGFVEAAVALNKLGANALLLNTGFAAPQLAEVLQREACEVVLQARCRVRIFEFCIAKNFLAHCSKSRIIFFQLCAQMDVIVIMIGWPVIVEP